MKKKEIATKFIYYDKTTTEYINWRSLTIFYLPSPEQFISPKSSSARARESSGPQLGFGRRAAAGVSGLAPGWKLIPATHHDHFPSVLGGNRPAPHLSLPLPAPEKKNSCATGLPAGTRREEGSEATQGLHDGAQVVCSGRSVAD